MGVYCLLVVVSFVFIGLLVDLGLLGVWFWYLRLALFCGFVLGFICWLIVFDFGWILLVMVWLTVVCWLGLLAICLCVLLALR